MWDRWSYTATERSVRPFLLRWQLCRRLPQLRQFPLVAAGKDRESAPGLGVEVLVVQMKAGSIPLPLPLVAAPEAKEPLDPQGHLLAGKLRILDPHHAKNLDRLQLVPDRQPLDLVEDFVGHQVGLIGLLG